MNVDSLDKLCMGLKGTTQGVKWGNDLCYMVGEKMFCVTNLEGAKYISFKTSPEDFGELTARTGIIPAPYAARNYWVLVKDLPTLSAKEWKLYVTKSYTLVFEKLPKKLKNSL